MLKMIDIIGTGQQW